MEYLVDLLTSKASARAKTQMNSYNFMIETGSIKHLLFESIWQNNEAKLKELRERRDAKVTSYSFEVKLSLNIFLACFIVTRMESHFCTWHVSPKILKQFVLF